MTDLPDTGPRARLGAFVAWLTNVPAPRRDKPEEILYGIDERPPLGTLIGISARFRTTVDTLAARNHIHNRHSIIAGTVLHVADVTGLNVESIAVAVFGAVVVVFVAQRLGGGNRMRHA